MLIILFYWSKWINLRVMQLFLVSSQPHFWNFLRNNIGENFWIVSHSNISQIIRFEKNIFVKLFVTVSLVTMQNCFKMSITLFFLIIISVFKREWNFKRCEISIWYRTYFKKSTIKNIWFKNTFLFIIKSLILS